MKKKETYLSKNPHIQSLHHLEQILATEVGKYLVLLEEGNTIQIENAKSKAKNALLKYGSDLEKIAGKLGQEFPEKVDNFLKSIDTIVHSAQGWVDEAKIANCFRNTESLEKEIAKAA